MKKIVYLAPLALLGMGVKASANQVPTHISNALRIYEQESQPVGQNENEQSTQQAEPSLPNGQNQLIGKGKGKGKETTHISRLDSGLIGEDSSVVNGQASQVMKISRGAIPTKQELNESKDSVAEQYVQVQQNRVAQFNNGSKIYGLNNSDQLSKNNGDGYVITNAGTYNGRAVDIGVTINKVSEQQGNYTTKWSNGDEANVTGKTDASFKYQNSVLAGTQQNNVAVPNQTRNRPENKEVTANSVDHTFYVGWDWFAGTDYANVQWSAYAISPKLLTDVMTYYDVDSFKAADMILKAYAKPEADIVGLKAGEVNYNSTSDPMYKAYSALTDELITNVNKLHTSTDGEMSDTQKDWNGLKYAIRAYASYMKLSNNGNTLTDHNWLTLAIPGTQVPNFSGYGSANHYIGVLSEKDNKFDPQIMSGDTNKYLTVNTVDVLGSKYQDPEYGTEWHLSKEAQDIFNGTNKYTIVKPVQVTDHLQLANKTDASLDYNYTIGVYDAQTGELIKDLTANYKGKVGKTATDQDIAMNNAVKAKIQAINTNQANSAYTGTAANDAIVFNKNTVHVNYVDTRGESIDVPGYDIDVDNLTSGNYQVPQNYTLVNTNGFKVTKNTHEVNGVTVTDSYNFIDQGNNKVTDNGRTLSVVLTHGTKNVDLIHSNLSNDATNNVFVINNGAKRQINSQSRHFGASGVLDLVTNKVTKQGDWVLLGKSNFDQTNIDNDLVGYGNAIHSNLTFLTL